MSVEFVAGVVLCAQVRASALPSWMKHAKMRPILQKMIDPVLAAKGTVHDNIRYIPNPVCPR
jgi:hypothetical protein